MSRTASLVHLAFASLVLAPLPCTRGLPAAHHREPLGIPRHGWLAPVETITGQTLVRGRVVAVKSYTDGPDAGLQNYWLLAPDGSVMLAGFSNPSAALAWAYDADPVPARAARRERRSVPARRGA